MTQGIRHTVSLIENQQMRKPHPPHSTYSHLLLLTIGFLALISCRTSPPISHDTLPLHTTTTPELVTLLNQRSEQIQTLKALLQLQAQGSVIPIRRSMNVSLSYRRPALIRLRAFDPLGQTLLDMTSDQARFHVHLPTRQRIITGTHIETLENASSDTPSNRTLMLHFLRAVSTTVLASPINNTHQVTTHEEDDLYRIEVSVAEVPNQPHRIFWVERLNLDLVKEAILNETGENVLTVLYADYRILGPQRNIKYPFMMTIQDAVTDSQYTLKFQEVQINPELRPKTFDALRP